MTTLDDTKGNYKWVMLAVVSANYFLAQGTRQIYNAVLPQIKADFAGAGIDDLKLGLVGSAFTLVFGLVAPFAGLAADFLHRKWQIVVGTIVFSAGIFLSGYAQGIVFLVCTYGILNSAGQSMLPPCNSSLIGQFHVETRGTAFSVYQTAIYLGIVLCSCAAGWFAGLGPGGWRNAFVVFGAVGLVWSLFMAWRLRDTPQPVEAGASEKASVPEALKAFFAKPSALILMLTLGCYFYATYGFKTWAPMFLARTFPDLSPSAVVFHAVFWFYVGAFGGVVLGGRLSDRLKSLRPAIRFEIEIVGLLLCVPFIWVVSMTGSLPVMAAAILGFGFATGVYDSNLYAALMDVVSPRYRAVAVGIFGCGGCVIGSFGPATMGWMNQHFAMRTAFASLVVFIFIGVALLLVARLYRFNRDRV